MTPDTMFLLANTLVLPQWLLMIAAPRWSVTQWLVRTLLIPALLAVIYLYYLFSGSANLDFSSFSTLSGIKSLFTQDEAVLAGWVHYLAFDLVAGSWMLRDGQQRSINHFLLIPCLLFCFMLGPVGLLLYVVIRFVKKPDA
ncbi:ABA4-like family protein [Nibrella saemangeumensis]|uniref:ABA4-like family protein n=1 Tax=Nibrella saemangeumensis TaxID=1084526 RepID=A0ABP8MF17_9BACT